MVFPSPSPESALPSLGDVMDAVRAAFMETVKISKDDAARAVFEQVVEELGPQENIAEKPLATADDTEDGLPAVEHNHADKETTTLSEENAKQEQTDPKLNSSEQMLLLQFPDEGEVRHGVGTAVEK
ncbi:putative serine/threonine-protein kinase kinX isoform X2 [Clarias magur]|uniref:Putative serine/threonine-protein kinase kinX isoform X2 n=1 Tax=Clarias magur TaxID=1594786 RepID=A0A8J4U8T5_CLAMG|nr:putative serine/threonine-protein kinase kinX isoform X2 [Clarias magur]